MTVKAARGAKRRRQNDDCGKAYYDLNRPAPVCPECGTRFEAEARTLEASGRKGWTARGTDRLFTRSTAPLPAAIAETLPKYSGLRPTGEAASDGDEIGPPIEDVILEEDETDEGIENTKVPEKRHDE